jgi:hypothetical protein
MQNFGPGTSKAETYFEVALLRWTCAVVNRRHVAEDGDELRAFLNSVMSLTNTSIEDGMGVLYLFERLQPVQAVLGALV